MTNERDGMWMIDGHSDWLLNLAETKRDFFTESEIGHVDLPRLLKGQISAMLSAVFVRNEDLPHHALIQTLRGTDRLHRIVEQSNGTVQQILNVDDLAQCQDAGAFGAILHWEGAEAIDPEFVVLRLGYRLGLRSLGLVWSRPNIFAEGIGDRDHGRGLTHMGKELVRRCNDMGILVDVSHLNVAGFWDVVETTAVPFVASHSNARAINDHPRNLDDDQLKAIAEKGGLVGICFARSHLVNGAQKPEDVPMSVILASINHIVNLIGIEHVALGSDYDGTKLPAELYDAAQTPKLIDALRAEGYDDNAIQKIGRDNWVRVFGEVWK